VDAGTAFGVGELIEELHGGEQVALDLDVAGDVGAGESELVRCPQGAPQSTAGGEPHLQRGGGRPE